MKTRGLFIADGSSDLPLASLLETLMRRAGSPLSITPVEAARIPKPSKTLTEKLRSLVVNGAEFDVLFVHRDAEGQSSSLRESEILSAFEELHIACPLVMVIPVRMTEAWLLLDESAIRRVAGRPHGKVSLQLPRLKDVESIADPKATLKDALLLASETTGRRRKDFNQGFGRHRQLLIERLNPDGDVTKLSAWQAMVQSVASATRQLKEKQ